jgi:drug/metabolite transporter (DMT)-like permease
MRQRTAGWLNGFAGVLIFSGSLPATRIAVASMDPLFLTFARAAIAGLLALVLLSTLSATRPARGQWAALAVVAAGVVIGFPLLTALALRHLTSAHAIIFLGLLPAATAIFAVLRGGERPRPAFWLFAAAGSLAVAAYAGGTAGIITAPAAAAQMLAAILVCGLGYAEGAKLSRTLGGWNVICWALVLALPATLPLAMLTRPASFAAITVPAWWALAYVSLFSMLIGFIFWYRGLAQGGIAGVGQLQLLQPLFGLLLAALLLHEPLGWPIFAVAVVVMLCVGGAKRFSPREIASKDHR